MNTNAQQFKDYMEQKNMHVTVKEIHDGEVAIEAKISTETVKLDVFNIFDDDNKHIKLRVFDFVHVPEDRFGQVLLACNAMNRKYKFVKFVLNDDDGNVLLEDDAVVNEDTVAEEAFELLVRMVQIGEDAYPEFMKAIYA